MKIRNILASAFVLVTAGNASGENYPDYGLARDMYGVVRCFHLDAQGATYGTSVADYNCIAMYRAWNDRYGSFRCYGADIHGTPFGPSVSDELCHERYSLGWDNYGAIRCFNMDRFGKRYGSSVAEYHCRGQAD